MRCAIDGLAGNLGLGPRLLMGAPSLPLNISIDKEMSSPVSLGGKVTGHKVSQRRRTEVSEIHDQTPPSFHFGKIDWVFFT